MMLLRGLLDLTIETHNDRTYRMWGVLPGTAEMIRHIQLLDM